MHQLSDPVMRRSLLSLIRVEERFATLRAQLVASFLNELADGSSVALYGCGSLAKTLAADHRASLERLAVTFLESRPDATGFFGFQKQAASSVVADPPETIVLLSDSFEASMLRELSGVDRTRIRTLNQVVDRTAGEPELAIILTAIRAEANQVLAELEPIFQNQEKTVCFVTSNLGIETLDRFRKVREMGYRVALLVPKGITLPPNPDALKVEEYLDYLHCGMSYVGLLHLLSLLLRSTDLIKVVHAWATLENHLFLEDWIDHGKTRVVFSCDIYFPSYFEHQPSIDKICRNIGVPFERLDRACEAIYGRAAGVLFKDSAKIFEDFKSRYGIEPTRRLFYLPELVTRRTKGKVEKYSDRDGEIHIVSGQSLHKDSLFSTMFDCLSLFREIEAVTSRQIHFTLFNNLDLDGANYPEFLDLDEQNPYFHYRFRVPFPQYVREIRKYDFGWVGNDPAMACILPTMFRRNLQLKILGYAQAGLPSLVDPQLEFCCELVEAEGIGMTIAPTQWSGIRALLEGYDMDQARLRLDAFCNKLDIEIHIPEMTDFFNSIIS